MIALTVFAGRVADRSAFAMAGALDIGKVLSRVTGLTSMFIGVAQLLLETKITANTFAELLLI